MMKLIIAMIVCILAGCVEHHYGTEVKASALASFQAGITTEADVVKALGKPDSRTMRGDDDTYELDYVSVRQNAPIIDIDFPYPTEGLSRGPLKGTSVTFHFTHDGKLIDYSTTRYSITPDGKLIDYKN